ncbi:hypothetical protein M1446_03175 [Candidatus Dependentiae bacterium]|nr:hypothetical protein [Candidatus Dependentiae bacterium]
MNKCLKITCQIPAKPSGVMSSIQKVAKKYEVEGLVQLVEGEMKMVACGKKENVDLFVDELHAICIQDPDQFLEVEPFLKDKDYRGVFRIIE